ncbi:type I-E CRISPR-associated endoribonuclease Cas2 [Catenulispora sp. NL8]|uniref:Type I-E CRISPR-associated endoribonuclease Cas2 n=1 Tax=Catenulispora pinistramenti TaxID=2705254 RepID=A0ABS5KN19_9ACTN|nr:type I-E CRISPR-associated endoribonuclease Cas2e [Catenulispora pinistramenti]MBS2547458.1 type I-E CRISPR-associated endoribonuclease Cas2 [Catenulispora pinistramenti]
MANLTVINTSAVPAYVRGALSRWMLEPAPGLYVGTLSAKVREELWAVVSASVSDGAAVLVYPADTEQRFAIQTAGTWRREVVDFEGLALVALNQLEEDNETATS